MKKATEKHEGKTPNSNDPIANKPFTLYPSVNGFVIVCTLLPIGLAIALFAIANDVQESHLISALHQFRNYWILHKNHDIDHLNHVIAVLEQLGYRNESNWDLLWSHIYPFRKVELTNLQPHQKVNKFPGTGWITNKVDLVTSDLKYIPPAFRLPTDREKLMRFFENNPQTVFVQKDNEHRHIKIVKINEIDSNSKSIFVQKFVENPFLINGFKFDIGVYVVLTSVDPLRVYIYNVDALLRFCPEKYHPFNASNIDKYIIGDDYLPIWDVPDLQYHFETLKFGMKESLNAYVRAKGMDPRKIWEQIEDSIRIVFLDKEANLIRALRGYKSKQNFFEMMRFDFIIDETLTVHLMEANMSPNLSSAHFPRNRLYFEQIIYNLFGLVGVANRIFNQTSDTSMEVADKNIAVFPDECASLMCKSDCVSPICQLCHVCLSAEMKLELKRAFREYKNRGDYKRIFPPPLHQGFFDENLDAIESYSPENKLLLQWFWGKCLLDASWCN